MSSGTSWWPTSWTPTRDTTHARTTRQARSGWPGAGPAARAPGPGERGRVSIEIANESGTAVDEAGLAAVARHVLDGMRVHPLVELSVLLVDKPAMADLQARCLGCSVTWCCARRSPRSRPARLTMTCGTSLSCCARTAYCTCSDTTTRTRTSMQRCLAC